jgi:thiosulfate/3-mercaptopyruvate sulfurtransferase
MMPSEKQFAEVMSQNGIGEGNRVVIYDRAGTVWAARLWWMFRTFGFEHAAILNGGWRKWFQEGRPVSEKICDHPHARFTAHFQPERITSKAEVLSEVSRGNTCLINTLRPESYRQEHIPGSINIPYTEMFDPETSTFLDLKTLRKLFEEHGVAPDTPIITYCRAGITACSDAFILTLLGQKQVAVYDGSMSEWLTDGNLPVEKG